MPRFPGSDEPAPAPGEHEEDTPAVDMEEAEGAAPAAKALSGRRKKAAKTASKKQKPGSFEAMGLSVPILKAIKRKGFQLPTPIQRKTIPLILQGVDVVGMARTGSGKTGAFVIPLIERLGSHVAGGGARALFLAPTRELALQTYKVTTDIGKHTDLRTAVLVGGDSLKAQFAELAACPDVLVATPGRLLHHLSEVPGFGLRTVTHVVLDEADRLFEMGLGEQVSDIVRQTASARQVLLFSATLPAALAEFTRIGLRSPELVRLDADNKLSPDLRLHFYAVRAADKPAALLQVLQDVLPAGSPTIVFAATKHRVEYLTLLLEQERVPCCAVYGAMDQAARKISVGKFRAGRVAVMLVTDVAARGIDIPTVDNVLNYDFTPKPKLFVHRAGRAARAGRPGTAVSLVTSEDYPYLIDLHLFLSRPLRVAPQLPDGSAEGGGGGGADDVDSMLGAFPEALLDLSVERARECVARDASIQALESSCANAFALYKRTRPAASTESLKRARALPRPGPHPVLVALAERQRLGGAATEAAKADITQALKRFRPAATVLEAQVAGGRKGHGAGHNAVPGVRAASKPEHQIEVMRVKRAAHGQRISGHYDELENRAAAAEAANATDTTTAAPARPGAAGAHLAGAGAHGDELAGGRFREEGFFIAHERGNRHQESGFALAERGHNAIAAEVLDLNAEDSAGLAAQKRRRTVWDGRKKRYVTLQADEVMKGGKRVATGASRGGAKKEDEKKGQMYRQWVKQVGVKAAEALGKGTKGGHSSLAGRFKRGGRGWDNPLELKRANAAIKDDVKSEKELRKDAARRERTKQHLQAKSKVKKKQKGGAGQKGAKGKGGRRK